MWGIGIVGILLSVHMAAGLYLCVLSTRSYSWLGRITPRSGLTLFKRFIFISLR
jgi:hypothetical protein